MVAARVTEVKIKQGGFDKHNSPKTPHQEMMCKNATQWSV